MARQTGRRQKRGIIPTLIGAGITERMYFTHLCSLFGYRMRIQPHFFGTESIDGLNKKIKDVLSNEGYAIVVFDADVSTWDAAEKAKLDKMRRDFSDNDNVLLCDSLPSIEYWFLLHYKNTNRHFGTSSAVIKELKKYLKEFDKTQSFLKNEAWVREMSGDGKLDEAIERAKAFGTEGESYSQVFRAIDKIRKH